MKLKSQWLIKPHTGVSLDDYDASSYDDCTEDAAKEALDHHRKQLAALQEVLYAGQQHSVLIVLQGMDTAGKDGTISHIFSGINPQGCDVASFKVPTPLEARHDFLWRCHAKVPAAGMMGIFNRSHYEQVLAPRVHKVITARTAHDNMDQINDFESMLAESGTLILKFFLHISREEQKKRLQSRLDDKEKHWKFSEADLRERAFWPQYQSAYEDVLSRTSRKHAPWFVIPSNHKWYRNYAIAEILVNALSTLKLSYPKPTVDVSKIKL
jgi:PPK2 family polyphosphate:nucleotide phosphotransferase